MAYWQHYFTPTTVADALGLLRQYGDQAQIIAGGTDLILDMQTGAHAPIAALVDVTHITGLAEIRQEDNYVVVGAAVTHTQIERSALIRAHGMALVESCSVVGGPQVRNVATLGGNVAHALPAADGTIGLVALNAEVQVCTLPEDGALVCEWQPLLSIFAGPGRNNLDAQSDAGCVSFWLAAAAAKPAPSTASCARKGWLCRSWDWPRRCGSNQPCAKSPRPPLPSVRRDRSPSAPPTPKRC